MDAKTTATEPFIRAPAAGATLNVLGVTHIYKATAAETANSVSLWEAIVPPGAGAPAHTHSREDESFYVLSGELMVEFEGAPAPQRLGPGGFFFGARFRLVSGDLYTPQAYGFYDENSGSFLPSTTYPQYTQRMPVFQQLDLRVDKTWKFRHWSIASYLDIQNVYNAGNVEGISYNYNYTKSVYAQGLPFLPSLGGRVEF